MAMNELYKMTAHQVKEGNFNKAILAVAPAKLTVSTLPKAATLLYLTDFPNRLQIKLKECSFYLLLW